MQELVFTFQYTISYYTAFFDALFDVDVMILANDVIYVRYKLSALKGLNQTKSFSIMDAHHV